MMGYSHKQKFEEIEKQEEAFRTFYENAKSIFNKLQAEDSSSQIYKDRCMLCICPGSRDSGKHSDIVEVFWGSHPVKKIGATNNFQLLPETGVTLFFNLLPDGHVLISMYPAKNEIMRPIEDHILLHRFCKAEWLNKKKNQKALWRDFMAYTECTSLIGTPSLYQRLRMSWVKYSRPIYVNGVQQPIKMVSHFGKIISFALTVGLSGFLLVAVQQCNKEKSLDYSPLIEETKNKIESVRIEQAKIIDEVQAINDGIDSLIVKVPQSHKPKANPQN